MSEAMYEVSEMYEVARQKAAYNSTNIANLDNILAQVQSAHKKLGDIYSSLQKDMDKEQFRQFVTLTGYIFLAADINYVRKIVQIAQEEKISEKTTCLSEKDMV